MDIQLERSRELPPLEEVVQKTSHLQEPQSSTIGINTFIPIEITEIRLSILNYIDGRVVRENIPTQEVVYVAGISDGKIFFSSKRGYSRGTAELGPIRGENIAYPLSVIVFYETVKKLE